METIMDTIVDSLFCFFVTLGKFPNSSIFSKFSEINISPVISYGKLKAELDL